MKRIIFSVQHLVLIAAFTACGASALADTDFCSVVIRGARTVGTINTDLHPSTVWGFNKTGARVHVGHSDHLGTARAAISDGGVMVFFDRLELVPGDPSFVVTIYQPQGSHWMETGKATVPLDTRIVYSTEGQEVLVNCTSEHWVPRPRGQSL